MSEMTDRFRALHADGSFLMPNPWDVGSARILESLGFEALATTSSGFAETLGKVDQQVTRDELVAHVAAVTAAIDVPLNVDAERGYSDDLAGIATTVDLLAEAGAAGLSIEDYDPGAAAISEIGEAVERVGAAAEAAARHGVVLTARCENRLYGVKDLDDTVARLQAYREAGAEVVYAPGWLRPDDVTRLVDATDAPLNVLALPQGPPVPELASLGVRRVSIGGMLTRAAWGALVRAARELQETGTYTYTDDIISRDDHQAAFAPTRA